MSENESMPKAYEHENVESHWYDYWEKKGVFRAEDSSEKPPFSIVIPPPNVTGSLHIGHALTLTLQDIMIRQKRMAGYNTLWLPGTDHAGIATQMVVERHLRKERQLSRFDLGREAFIKEVWRWKDQYHARITKQTRALGASVDWSRERFTMDEGLSEAVKTVFVKLYKDGLIYRDARLVNWSPGIHTVLSDLEVEHQEQKGHLWHIAYPVTGSDERLIVATTRPETMVGDSAVAVHPDDQRYQHLIGKTIDLPLTDRKIPIIADAILVDMAFGTGAVKVTPAHDFNDFETGKRHDLPMISILDKDAKMNEAAPAAYQGLDRFAARKRMVEDLEALGLLVKIEDHVLNVGHCQRTGVVVEPMLSTQWYVKVGPLAEKAMEAVRTGKTKFTSEEWRKVYFHWMENIQDWCISRQLWWGHQIPAYYCGACDHVTVSMEAPGACEACQSTDLRQDEDVLDTWFSSGLWPFSTLGWPEKTEVLKTFYPNSVMETGFDIIFFWVARMMMMGLYLMDDVPFKTIYLHPMVRDEKGQKMSKTRNNVIDPLEIIEDVGADALRFTLTALSTQGHDLNFSLGRLEGYRNFGNKLWNATRFILMNLEERGEALTDLALHVEDFDKLSKADKWILHRLQESIEKVTASLDNFEFANAANEIYQFFWSEFCDWYIEFSKSSFKGDKDDASFTFKVLLHCLDQALRLLHPMMPFITEELWQRLPIQKDAETLALAAWPSPEPAFRDPENAALIAQQIALIGAIRTIRGELGISPRLKLDVLLSFKDEAEKERLSDSVDALKELAQIGTMTMGMNLERPGKSAVAVAGQTALFVKLEGVIDLDGETSRLRKNIAKLEKELSGLETKLQNKKFMERAPLEVVNEQKERLARTEHSLKTYRETLEGFLQ